MVELLLIFNESISFIDIMINNISGLGRIWANIQVFSFVHRGLDINQMESSLKAFASSESADRHTSDCSIEAIIDLI